MRSPLSASERALIIVCVLVYLFLVVFSIGAFWGGCHNPNGRNYGDHYSNNEDCALDGVRLFFIDVSASLKQAHDAIDAISTAVVAIFTAVLVFVTREQAKLTKRSADIAARSADIAEKGIIDLEAPFITVKIIEGIKVTKQGGERGTIAIDIRPIKFVFVNHGRTPAQLIAYSAGFQVTDDRHPDPDPVNPLTAEPELLPSGIFVMPAGGESEPRYKFPGVFYPKAQAIWFVGYVKYRDIFNNGYTSGFSFVYYLEADRFILAGGSEYNYRRREDERQTTAT
jgi:hypothetical protein